MAQQQQHPSTSQERRQVRAWIAKHAIDPIRRLTKWYGKNKKKTVVIAAVWIATNLYSFGVGSFLKPSLVPWFAERFTHQHQLDIFMSSWRTEQPKCTLQTVSLGTGDSIQSLHIVLSFDQEIHAAVLQRGYARHGNKLTINTDSSFPRHTTSPCEIAAKSADKDDSLTFATSSDRHQIIISGHDVTLYDTQTFLVALYPDETVAATPIHIDWDADVTYQAFGYAVPVKFSFYGPGPNGNSIHLFDTNQHLVRLQ